MVVIWVILGVLLVQLLSKLLVRMCLDAEGLVDGQDLEEEWQLVLIFLADLLGHESLVVLYEV